MTRKIYTIKTRRVGDARLSVVDVAGWPVILTGWPAGRCGVTVGVVSQPAADAERYRCASLQYSAASIGRVLVRLTASFPGQPAWAVSYTHLTLPTNREV